MAHWHFKVSSIQRALEVAKASFQVINLVFVDALRLVKKEMANCGSSWKIAIMASLINVAHQRVDRSINLMFEPVPVGGAQAFVESWVSRGWARPVAV